MIPVQNARSGGEQAFSLGLVGRVGPFAGDPQDQFAADAGFLFLPGRRVRFVGVIVSGGIVAAEAAVDAELGLVQQMFAALETDGLGEEGTQALVKALERLADLEVQ